MRTDRPSSAGLVLGFALGGFFDGILLHQVLQWHHLLSAVAGWGDLRAQVLADGLFHAAMYLVALLGLWLLWRQRQEPSGRRLVAAALIGFGAWHVADAVLSHWLLGIHRIRMDSAVPLVWDLAWVLAFGVLAIAAGGWLARRPGGPPGRAVAAALALAIATAGPVAALPPATGPVLALFRPDMRPEAVFRAVAAIDGRIVAGAGDLWVIAPGPRGDTGALYREGAWLVSRSLVGAGCIAWLRA